MDIPVIYVSHSTDEVARLADYLVLLEAGSVEAAGAISDILTRLDLPLAHGKDAEALIEATVSGYDEDYHLTYLDSAGGRFTVIHRELPLGNAVRLRIAARRCQPYPGTPVKYQYTEYIPCYCSGGCPRRECLGDRMPDDGRCTHIGL